ncbi:MAG: thrombospondin type 3 repeat-containing protein [Candidatus Moraniibacteriota bacterium]
MKILFLSLAILLASTAWAKDELDINNLRSAFRLVTEVSAPESAIPNVLEVPIEFENSMLDSVMVVEQDSLIPQAALVLNKQVIKKNNLTATDSMNSDNSSFLTDGEIDNFLDYPAGNLGDAQSVTIDITANELITTSSLRLYLDKFVSLPKSIEVRAIVSGEEKIILGKKGVTSDQINFPKVSTKNFKITLEYIQPLRIREITINQENANISEKNSVRFLAQPNKKYEIYFNADRYVNSFEGESPNLVDSRDVLVIKGAVATKNEFYEKSDMDKDGIADEADNCVTIKNPDQEDVNDNGRGDACDDFDRDGVINQKDNCRDITNRDQKDVDLDGVGNACDQKENRILQNQKWLPLALILFVAGVVGILFFKATKAKQ